MQSFIMSVQAKLLRLEKSLDLESMLGSVGFSMLNLPMSVHVVSCLLSPFIMFMML